MRGLRRRFGHPFELLGSGRSLFGWAYGSADSVLDFGQRHAFRYFWFYLPETSVARQAHFQQVFASRFLSDAGQQAIVYGAIVAVVRAGGSALEAALLGVAAVLPPALLGLYGGAVADALPKRVALAAAYNLQALLCFSVPWLIGTDLGALLFLIFAVNTLGQVSGPTESAVLPHVATRDQLASAASLISLSSSLGTAFGTAVFAPVVVRAFGVEPVIYIAGVLLLLAATRVFDLRGHEHDPPGRSPRELFRRELNLGEAVEWLLGQPAVTTMVFVGVLAGTASVVIQMLAPLYVQTVLDVDAADAVYVFAPTVAGLGTALAIVPRLIPRIGERNTALLGFCVVSFGLAALGAVALLAPVIDVLNPIRLLDPVGLDLTPKLRTASLLALPLGFGVATATVSVQTYVNRRVPLARQGRTFALQSALKNGLSIVPLTTLAAATSVVGTETVMLVAPFLLLAIAYALIQVSRHFGNHAPRRRPLDALATFWEEPPDDAHLAPGGATP